MTYCHIWAIISRISMRSTSQVSKYEKKIVFHLAVWFKVHIMPSYCRKYWKTCSSFLQLHIYLQKKSNWNEKVWYDRDFNSKKRQFFKKVKWSTKSSFKTTNVHEKKIIIYNTPSKHKVNKLLKYENYLTWDENKEFSPGV